MDRKKRFWVVLLVITVAGMGGVILHVFDFSRQYTRTRGRLLSLHDKMDHLNYRLFTHESKLAEYDLLKFKSFSLSRRYPRFSSIVETVYHKSRQYDLDPSLVLGIINIESNFNPTALSSRGAYGLMQIHHRVWKNELSINKKDIFKIDYNVELGLKILKRYLAVSKGDMHRALHLYNNGYKYNNTKYTVRIQNSPFLDSRDLSFSLVKQ